MNINIQELQKISDLLFLFLQQKVNGANLNIDKQDLYYQKIWHTDRNLTSEPDVSLGFINEDLKDLTALLHGESPCSLDLEKLGAVLTTIGAVLTKKNNPN